MAGKKGMKHRRPKTAEERDSYAKTKIEYLLDKAIEGKAPGSWDNVRIMALKIRYDKLRPTLGATTVTERKEGWLDVMRRMSQEAKLVVQDQEQTENKPAQEQVQVIDLQVTDD